MAPRITADEVRSIIDVDPCISDLEPFITAGNLVVTATLGGQSLGADLLKEIERNVVAHFITSRDPRASQEEAEDVKVKYEGKFGKFLESSRYGQMALLLDSTGLLARRGAKKASLGIISYSTAEDPNR